MTTTAPEIRVLTEAGPITVVPCGSRRIQLKLAPGEVGEREVPTYIEAGRISPELCGSNTAVVRLIAQHIAEPKPSFAQLLMLGADDRSALVEAILSEGEES